MAIPRSSWRRFAWNGVCFDAPSGWETARIGARDLMLEDTAGPAMEIKWGPVRGKFSHAQQLKRLASARHRKTAGRVTAMELPARWQAALDRFEATGFLWKGERLAGRGAILYCPACRQASLIQFFHHGKSPARYHVPRVLSSFRDHSPDSWREWSIFDVQAKIPENYELARHRFAAGRFELTFGFNRQILALHRWAPASVLLSGTDLPGFARQRIGFPGGQPAAATWRGHPALEWGVAPAALPGGRWWGKFKAKHPYKWLRLWHVEQENRILAVRAEGKRPFEPGLLDTVCAAYETV